MLFSTSLSRPLPRFFGTGVARAEVQSEQTAAQAEIARTPRENAEGGVYMVSPSLYRVGYLSVETFREIMARITVGGATPELTRSSGCTEEENLLTRGV